MAKYLIDDSEISSEAVDFMDILKTAYEQKLRPICLCTPEGPEMYIAHLGEIYFIKRMPGTGTNHSFRCGSFEPPAELSGLGNLIGSAIQDQKDKNTTSLKLGFSFTKGGDRSAPEMGEGNGTPGEIKAKPTKMTMRALLHYLFEQSGLTKFESRFDQKRNWYYVRLALMQSLENKTAKNSALSKMLYIPETFILDKKDEITKRRRSSVSGAMYNGKARQGMMMIIGMVKDISVNKYGGYLVTFKHLSDFKFKISDDQYAALTKAYAFEHSIWLDAKQEKEKDSDPDQFHLIMMGTFYLEMSGYPRFESCTMMIVDSNWIPFESSREKYVLESLTEEGRPFMKCLRYDLNRHTPFASFLLTDTQGTPTAMYIEQDKATEAYSTRLEQILLESKLQSWVWRTAVDHMPEIPEGT